MYAEEGRRDFFLCRQKAECEISDCLVGSEMCIGDSERIAWATQGGVKSSSGKRGATSSTMTEEGPTSARAFVIDMSTVMVPLRPGQLLSLIYF